jgi:hypothetical protein
LNRIRLLPLLLFFLVFASWANAGLQLDFNHPTDANYIKDTTVAIIFTVIDSNSETTDINADIYYDSAQGGQSNHVITDLNLHESGRCTDVDFTDGAICQYNWDTTGITDGNYYIDVNIYSLVPGGCADQNGCQVEDLNNDSNSFMLDKTGPTSVTIVTPAHPLAPKVVVTYSASDATAGIKKYWVSTDGTTYTDNGTSTTVTVNCAPGHSTPFYLKVMDSADNNSDVSSTTVGCEEVSGPPYCGDGACSGNETAATCPEDCSAICGDGACTHTESVENCPQDCEGCGDGLCAEDESCETCPGDCGVCEEEEEEFCGDGICSVWETCKGCPEDCGVCENEGQTAGPETAPQCSSDSECNDYNPCTVDRCVAGKCSLVPLADKTSCGYGRECMAGQCVAVALEQPPLDNTLLLAGGAIAVVVLLVAGYFVYSFYFRG